MFIRNEIKSALQSSNSFLISNKSVSQEKISQEQTTQQSPKKRSLLKQKHNLIPLTDQLEIRKCYYNEQQNQELKSQEHRLQNSLQKNKINLLPKLEGLDSDKSLYQTVIEIFPADHSIWNDLVEKSQTIEEVIDSNPAFFLGLMTLYVQQSKLQTLKNKFQLKAIQTQYQQDYQNMNIGNQDVLLDQSKAHDQMWGQNLKQLYNGSVYNKSQYLPFKVEKQRKSPNNDFNPNLSQSSQLSTYRSQFQNWKPQYPGKMTRESSSVEPSNLPFISESSYAREYKNVKTERSPLQKKTKLGPFAEKSQQLVKESTSSYYQQCQLVKIYLFLLLQFILYFKQIQIKQNCYQILKTKIQYSYNNKIPSKLMRPISPKLFNASFEGQYTTEFNKSYNINSDQESSFANKFYESNSVKKIFDRKFDSKIF